MFDTHIFSNQTNEKAEKAVLVRNLSIPNLIYFLLATCLVIATVYIRDWIVTTVILIILAGGLLLTARFNSRIHKRLTEIWSELARLTGLEFKRGRLSLIGIFNAKAIPKISSKKPFNGLVIILRYGNVHTG